MEAWKFVDYSSLSPLFALSLTTEQWGLEPFPGNLVAISGYWKDIKGSNNTFETAWTLPNSCSSSDSSYFYYTNGNPIGSGLDSVTNISESTNICPKPQPCADSGCIILIEGIGKTTTGPANSRIVGLSLGISFLLAIVINMGCFESCFREPKKRLLKEPRPLNPPDPNPLPRPPRRREQQYFEQAPTLANMAKEVARCSALLRQMYALELAIWGMEGCVDSEIPQRDEMKRKANAIFAEIRRMVHTWRSRYSASWTAVEQQHVEEIYRFVGQHGARRYNMEQEDTRIEAWNVGR